MHKISDWFLLARVCQASRGSFSDGLPPVKLGAEDVPRDAEDLPGDLHRRRGNALGYILVRTAQSCQHEGTHTQADKNRTDEDHQLPSHC